MKLFGMWGLLFQRVIIGVFKIDRDYGLQWFLSDFIYFIFDF